MLLEIKVSHFAIIDNLHIQFKKGLNILSGETGAGKSVLLKSLSLLMGVKGSSESIRTGETSASIEGVFDLDHRSDIKEKLAQMDIPFDDGILVVRRVISEEKSKVYLNGTLSTLNHLRDLVAPLIEIAGNSAPLIELTGQHDSRHLLSKSYHLDLLDQYCGLNDDRAKYQKLYAELKKTKEEIENLEKNTSANAQKVDYLKFQQKEIAELDLSPGEDIEIEGELKKMKNFSKVNSFLDQMDSALVADDDSALNRISKILMKAQDFKSLDANAEKEIANLNQAKFLIQEFSYQFRKMFDSDQFDPTRLEKLESRLSAIRKLQKKFGQNTDDILKALLIIETEISHIENAEVRIKQLQVQTAQIEKQLLVIATAMHKKRVSGADLLQNSVNKELSDLNMKGVKFVVGIEALPILNSTGNSDVEFLSQSSTKDGPKPLAKYASGGELSRILLSLKRVIGTSQYPRTYLFDEVDTGVSGPTAEKVGKKLKSIAKGQQVICITHLPQVAIFGDSHFFIQKSPKNKSISMEVQELNKKERITEIARLISGEKITKTSLAHAEQLLDQAK